MTVRLHGERVSGRYALFRTRGKDWMIHRMDPPVAGRSAPAADRADARRARASDCRPTTTSGVTRSPGAGARAIALCDTGHLELQGAGGEDLRPRFPELFAIALELGGEPVAIDGVIAVLGEDGTASRSALERRLGGALRLRDPPPRARHAGDPDRLRPPPRRAREPARAPVRGAPRAARGARARRPELADPGLPRAARATRFAPRPAHRASTAIVAKRLASPYRPGRRSRDWRRIGIA